VGAEIFDHKTQQREYRNRIFACKNEKLITFVSGGLLTCEGICQLRWTHQLSQTRKEEQLVERDQKRLQPLILCRWLDSRQHGQRRSAYYLALFQIE